MGCINAVSEQSACNSQQHGCHPIVSFADSVSDEWRNARKNATENSIPPLWPGTWQSPMSCTADSYILNDIEGQSNIDSRITNGTGSTHAPYPIGSQLGLSNQSHIADRRHCRIFPDLNDSQSLTQYSGLTNSSSGMNATLANINDPYSAFPCTDAHWNMVADTGLTENRGKIAAYMGISENRGSIGGNIANITRNCGFKEADSRYITKNRDDKVADTGTTENRGSEGANTGITENQRGHTGKSENRDDKDVDTSASYHPLYELIEKVSDYLKSLGGNETLAKLLGESIPKYVQYFQPDGRKLLLNKFEYADILSDIKSSVEEKYRSIAETIIDREKTIEHLDAVFEINRIVIQKLLEAAGLSQGFVGFVLEESVDLVTARPE